MHIASHGAIQHLCALRRQPAADTKEIPKEIQKETQMTQFHDLTMDSITGEPVDFSTFKDTLCLVVNVASR